jgi:transcriptional regulator GlxA family with amidase domain
MTNRELAILREFVQDGARLPISEAKALLDEVERLQARLREVAQILICEFGAEGPMQAEDVARKAVFAHRQLRRRFENVP